MTSGFWSFGKNEQCTLAEAPGEAAAFCQAITGPEVHTSCDGVCTEAPDSHEEDYEEHLQALVRETRDPSVNDFFSEIDISPSHIAFVPHLLELERESTVPQQTKEILQRASDALREHSTNALQGAEATATKQQKSRIDGSAFVGVGSPVSAIRASERRRRLDEEVAQKHLEMQQRQQDRVERAKTQLRTKKEFEAQLKQARQQIKSELLQLEATLPKPSQHEVNTRKRKGGDCPPQPPACAQQTKEEHLDAGISTNPQSTAVQPAPQASALLASVTPFRDMELRAIQRREAREKLNEKYAAANRLRCEEEARCVAEAQAVIFDERRKAAMKAKCRREADKERKELQENTLRHQQEIKQVVQAHNRMRLLRHYGWVPWGKYVLQQRTAAVNANSLRQRHLLRRAFHLWKLDCHTAKQYKLSLFVLRSVALLRVLRCCLERARFMQWRSMVAAHKRDFSNAVHHNMRRLVRGVVARLQRRRGRRLERHTAQLEALEAPATQKYEARLKTRCFMKWVTLKQQAQDDRERDLVREKLWGAARLALQSFKPR